MRRKIEISTITADIQALFGGICGADDDSAIKMELDYILDPNGRVRYLYPSSHKRPFFLRLYSASSFKGKVIVLVTNILFYLRLSFLVKNGSLTFFVRNEAAIVKNILGPDFKRECFCVFFGTYGPDRKLVLEYHDKDSGNSIGFAKIPVGVESIKLIKKERENIEFLAYQTIVDFVFPAVKNNDSDKYLVLSKVFDFSSAADYSKINQILTLHTISREEIQLHKLKALADMQDYLACEVRYCFFDTLSDKENRVIAEQFRSTIKKLGYLAQRVGLYKKIVVSFAHKDFTPWNSSFENATLSVIDWERAEFMTPIYYDFCHYIFQNEVMLRRFKTSSQLCEDVLARISQVSGMSSTVDKRQEAITYFACYLIDHIFYRVDLYSTSTDWFPQIGWQIEAWSECIEYTTGLFSEK